MGEHLVADCETDGLLPEMTKLHMVQVGSLHGADNTVYWDPPRGSEGVEAEARELGMTAELRPLKEGIERLKDAEVAYFHNGINFDAKAVNRFHPGTIERHRLRDTLVMARLLTREFDHSLAAWGRRLSTLKGDFKGPWDIVTPEFLVYSAQDTVTGRALTQHLLKLLPGNERACDTEHAVAYWVDQMVANGFHLDVTEAERLYAKLLADKADLRAKLRETFKPRWVSAGTYVPRVNRKDLGYGKDCPITRIEWDEFSPDSHQAIARRLQEMGWKPTKFTKGGAPQTDEETLLEAAKRFPAATLLVEYLDLAKQSGAVGGDKGWLKCVEPDGRVHGRVNPIGAYTQRMSHSMPNTTTIPKKGPYRALWVPRPGWKLVGVDGEGIQARAMAHYLFRWDKGKYGKIITEGRKEDGTDIHSLNLGHMKHLGLPDRDGAKNINYAVYFGAQAPKLGSMIGDACRRLKIPAPRVPIRELGMGVLRALDKTMTGLFAKDGLSETVEKTFKARGYLTGLDGRRLYPPSARNALVTLIQSAEAIIMKHALVHFCDTLCPANGWVHGEHYAFCANVHDEVQIEAPPELAQQIGDAFADAIAWAGESLNMKCAQAGNVIIGNNWSETH